MATGSDRDLWPPQNDKGRPDDDDAEEAGDAADDDAGLSRFLSPMMPIIKASTLVRHSFLIKM